MPLTDYQATLPRLLSKNRTFDSYLAGGAAILIEPNTSPRHLFKAKAFRTVLAERPRLESFTRRG